MDNTVLSKNAEHLKLLSIFHTVVAGLTAVFVLFPVMHLVFDPLGINLNHFPRR